MATRNMPRAQTNRALPAAAVMHLAQVETVDFRTVDFRTAQLFECSEIPSLGEGNEVVSFFVRNETNWLTFDKLSFLSRSVKQDLKNWS